MISFIRTNFLYDVAEGRPFVIISLLMIHEMALECKNAMTLDIND